MIRLTAIIVPAMLTGWIVGLTVHARRVVRWTDTGARVAWNAGAGTIGCAALMISLATCALTRPLTWLALPVLAVAIGAAGGWRACVTLDQNHADAPTVAVRGHR